MMIPSAASDYSLLPLEDGYPRVDDYAGVTARADYRGMRGFADAFLRENAVALADYARRWVADPLHHWSRRWEYVFVGSRLLAPMTQAGAERTILDAGAGLTFFPHWIAQIHPHVRIECCDRDDSIAADATRLVSPASDRVTYRTMNLDALAYPDSSLDDIYCISVLEHCENHEAIAAEFARTLKPGGRLLLTVDISVDGSADIPVQAAFQLVESLARHMTPAREYSRRLLELDEDRVLTTKHIRRKNPELLPWRKPPASASLRYFLRSGKPLKAHFSHLTCFCMEWTAI